MCNELVEQVVPSGYSCKVITMRCGSTAIDGRMLLCDACAKVRPNPPAWTYEDAGEADFEPFHFYDEEN